MIGAVAASLTDWLQATAGTGAAIAATVLAVFAYVQMKHREKEASQRARELAARDRAVRDQLHALANITEATRDAARAQVQPVIFTHAHGAPIRGPNEDHDLAEDEVAFEYYLSNEGTGPALNIKHGVEVAGVDYPFAGGMEFRAARPGEFLPGLDPGATQPIPSRFIRVVLRVEALSVGWERIARTYWARFENVFGDQFETRNPSDPAQSAAFMRTTEL